MTEAKTVRTTVILPTDITAQLDDLVGIYGTKTNALAKAIASEHYRLERINALSEWIDEELDKTGGPLTDDEQAEVDRILGDTA